MVGTEQIEPHHWQMLTVDSAISPEIIAGRGYRSLAWSPDDRRACRFLIEQGIPGGAAESGAGLWIPSFRLDGTPAGGQWRPDTPFVGVKGKPRKYVSPRGPNHLDVHPSQVELLRDPTTPVIIGEGLKKGDCLVSHGVVAVNLLGVDNWLTAGGTALPDWREISWVDRPVTILFDADGREKPGVLRAMREVGGWLEWKKAKVGYALVPGPEKGADDHIAAGRTVDELLSGVSTSPPLLPWGTTITAATVTPETIEWLWEGRIPRAKVTLLDGDPGVGKSTIWCSWAGRLTTGTPWPEGSSCPVGDVLVMAAEDGVADTIVPRLRAAGADLARVHVVDSVQDEHSGKDRPPLLSDVRQLRELIEKHHAALLVVDVLMAYLPGAVDSHKDQDIRTIMYGLSRLAEETGCAILLLRHLRKSGGSAINAGGGSIGIVGSARAAYVVGRDPENEHELVLATTKLNLARWPSSLRLRIVDAGDAGRVDWLGESKLTGDDLTAGGGKPGPTAVRKGDAKSWLWRWLTDQGGSAPRAEVETAAKASDHAWRTVERAADDLRVLKAREGYPSRSVWRLPPTEAVCESGLRVVTGPWEDADASHANDGRVRRDSGSGGNGGSGATEEVTRSSNNPPQLRQDSSSYATPAIHSVMGPSGVTGDDDLPVEDPVTEGEGDSGSAACPPMARDSGPARRRRLPPLPPGSI